jgi:hypothetical protein
MRPYAIAGLKANYGLFSPNIMSSRSLRKSARLALCVKLSLARWSADCKSGQKAASEKSATLSEKATEALRNGDRILERAQGESFFLTQKIAKMHRAIIDIAAERIAIALGEADAVDAPSIFAETLTSLIPEPVAATLRSIEQTRGALAEAMQVAAFASGQRPPDELPKPAGMPMVDVNEISQRIVIEKPGLFSLLGKGMLTSHVQRKLEAKYDRTLLEFLSLYANRLRRWMEQSINTLRNVFTEFADMHRAHFDVAAAPDLSDASALQSDLRVLRQWDSVENASAISSAQIS